MRHCHYQDVPGRRSICLRTLSHMHDWEEMRRLRLCDDERSASCPHQGWTEQGREMALGARSRWLDGCACGGIRHDTLRGRLQCMADHIVHPLLEPCIPSKREGSSDGALPDIFPTFIRERAWRQIRAGVVSRDGNTCQQCGRDLRQFPKWYTEVHHIIPVAHGGTDHPANLITLCTECHGGHTDHMQRNGGHSKGRSGARRDGRPVTVQAMLPHDGDD